MDRFRRKQLMAKKRGWRVRRKIHGTPERPRLAVFRSLKHIYCQVVNDEEGVTLASSSTPELKKRGEACPKPGNKDAAARIGKDIAERAKAAGVTKVVFDRGPYKYHGRIKALADAAREGGLKF